MTDETKGNRYNPEPSDENPWPFYEFGRYQQLVAELRYEIEAVTKERDDLRNIYEFTREELRKRVDRLIECNMRIGKAEMLLGLWYELRPTYPPFTPQPETLAYFVENPSNVHIDTLAQCGDCKHLLFNHRPNCQICECDGIPF